MSVSRPEDEGPLAGGLAGGVLPPASRQHCLDRESWSSPAGPTVQPAGPTVQPPGHLPPALTSQDWEVLH